MKPGFSFVLAGLALFCGAANAANNRADLCDRRWLDESGPYVNRAEPDYAALLAYWQTQEKTCAGTVTYEARLALIHYYLDDYAEARRVLAGIQDRKSPYYPVAEVVSLTIDISEIDLLPPDERPAALRQAREKLEQYTRRHPTSAVGFNMLASILSYLEDWHGALRALDQTQKLITPDVSKMGMYRNYTIVFTELGRYHEALESGEEALAYTTSLRRDPPFMLALMRAYAAQGRIEEMREVLQTLVDLVPGVHETPEFKRAVALATPFYEAAKAKK